MGSDSELTSSSSCSEALTFHQRKIKSEKLIKRHKCSYPGCNAAFNRPWKLERHKNSHTNERPFKCSFQGCGKDYKSKTHLQRHISVSHTQFKSTPVNLPCPVSDCPKTFANKWSLKKHIKTHFNSECYKCPDCDASFKKNNQLKNHSYLHAGTHPNACEICKKTFASRAKLICHGRKHTEYVCEYENCGMKCENWSALRKHLKLKHPKSFICDFCQKSFLNKNTLENHIFLHLPSSDRNVFKCTYEGCERYYFYNRNLQQHIKTFHEGKRFKCDWEGCHQTLATKKKLSYHKKLHGNPNPKKPPKVLDERRPRKDKGVRRKSMAGILSGIVLPSEIEHNLVINNVTPQVQDVIQKVTNTLLKEELIIEDDITTEYIYETIAEPKNEEIVLKNEEIYFN